MKRRRGWYAHLRLLLYLLPFLLSSTFSSNTKMNPDDLDSTIQKYALTAQRRIKTGIVYPVQLPKNLSGVTAAVIRIRSNSLWFKGLDVASSIHIPPKTIAIPQVKRLFLVYQDLGNLSTSYYNVQNYTLISPVIGLLAYDVSGDRLNVSVRGNPMVVNFPRVQFPKGSNPRSDEFKCVTLGSHSFFTNRSGVNECSIENQGHFAILGPSNEFGPSPSPSPGRSPAPAPSRVEVGRKSTRKWAFWVAVLGGGVAGLLVLCLLGAWMAKTWRRKREKEMRRKTEDGEVLTDVWVNGSRMPSASMARTQPALEQGSAP